MESVVYCMIREDKFIWKLGVVWHSNLNKDLSIRGTREIQSAIIRSWILLYETNVTVSPIVNRYQQTQHIADCICSLRPAQFIVMGVSAQKFKGWADAYAVVMKVGKWCGWKVQSFIAPLGGCRVDHTFDSWGPPFKGR